MDKNDLNDLVVNIENISDYIYIIRGKKVMLDADLAMLYGVETRALIQAVKRNIDRFPEDFAFQLNKDEWNFLRCQIGTLNINSLRSQNVILKTGSGKHRKYLPYAFTEQGVAMLSSALHSRQAIKINVEIMRAFVKLRHVISSHVRLRRIQRNGGIKIFYTQTLT